MHALANNGDVSKAPSPLMCIRSVILSLLLHVWCSCGAVLGEACDPVALATLHLQVPVTRPWEVQGVVQLRRVFARVHGGLSAKSAFTGAVACVHIDSCQPTGVLALESERFV